MKPAKFQIVKFDPGAAKFIGFAKQQCQRLIDNGTDDFYRFWNMGGGITIKAKSYCGSVKLWLEAAAGGARMVSINSAGSLIKYCVSTFLSVAAGIVTRTGAIVDATITSMKLPSWVGLPNDYTTSSFVSGYQGSVDATTGHAITTITFVATEDATKLTLIAYDIQSILPSGVNINYFEGSWLIGTDVVVLLGVSDGTTNKLIAYSRNLKTAVEIPAGYAELTAGTFRIMTTTNVLWMVGWSGTPTVWGIKSAATLTVGTIPLGVSDFSVAPDIQATQNVLEEFNFSRASDILV